MPSGVGAARTRVARVVFAAVLSVAGVALVAPPAQAQAAPTLTIRKVALGQDVTATFEVTGPGIAGTATLTAAAVAGGPPVVATPALTGLTGGANYLITETEPKQGLSPFSTSFSCTDDEGSPLQSGVGHKVIVSLTVSTICTFTNALVPSAGFRGEKIVTGDTSTWVRPAQFHITCPALQVDADIEPPVGPGGPGTYTIGQGAIPPATCTITETDTGSNGPVSVSMKMTNHGIPIATGTTAITFTSHAGDDLVLTVTNAFPPIDHPGDQGGGTTTTIAGGSTTTTIAPATTAPPTTVPGGGATTTSGGGGEPTAAPTTTPSELPTTGSPTGGLLVAALAAMLGGLVLVARTRRFVD